MGPHEEWEAGPGGFLEGVALALTMGGSLKAPGRGGAGSRTWFGRAGWESGAQLSSALLGDSQGAGSTGRAHGGCQAQTWSPGRLEAPWHPGQGPESPGHLQGRQQQGCQLRERSDGCRGEGLKLPRR